MTRRREISTRPRARRVFDPPYRRACPHREGVFQTSTAFRTDTGGIPFLSQTVTSLRLHMGKRGPIPQHERVRVLPGREERRAPPPEGITEDQARLWRAIVETEPQELFASEARKHLLRLYCEHATFRANLQGLIDRVPIEKILHPRHRRRLRADASHARPRDEDAGFSGDPHAAHEPVAIHPRPPPARQAAITIPMRNRGSCRAKPIAILTNRLSGRLISLVWIQR